MFDVPLAIPRQLRRVEREWSCGTIWSDGWLGAQQHTARYLEPIQREIEVSEIERVARPRASAAGRWCAMIACST